jgi:malate dehydrogenase (oxaloacetate-decarboxylating)
VVTLAALLNAARRSDVNLCHSTIGQIGLGAAGSGIVRLLRAYGVQRVLGTDRNPNAVKRLIASGGEGVTLESLMQRADIVIATTGVKGLIRPQWVKKGQVILEALHGCDADGRGQYHRRACARGRAGPRPARQGSSRTGGCGGEGSGGGDRAQYGTLKRR